MSDKPFSKPPIIRKIYSWDEMTLSQKARAMELVFQQLQLDTKDLKFLMIVPEIEELSIKELQNVHDELIRNDNFEEASYISKIIKMKNEEK